MVFVADDGKTFEDMKECQAYEDAINEKKKNKDKRLKELNDAYSKYKDLANKFRDDYGEDPFLDLASFFTRIAF